MTIITAKQPDTCLFGAPRLPASLALAPLALAAMLAAAPAHAAWRFTPQVDARETLSDNVNNQVGEYARSAWVSEVVPGFKFTEDSPWLKAKADAEYHSFLYSEKIPYTQSSALNYRADAEAKVVDQLLYVDASASQSRQAISAFGPTITNPFSSTNTTRISTWSISPFLRHRFGNSADLSMRYTRDSVNGGASGFGNSMASTRAVDLTSGPTFNDVAWNFSYNHQDLGSQYAGSSSSENELAGLRLNLTPRFGLTATAGYDKYDYPTLGEATRGRSWSGGFVWVPSTHTSVKASYGRRYFGKTGALASSYRTPHTIWTLNYDDQVTTSRSQFLIPATFDTASALNRLLATTFPDPQQRQQVVQSYIAATGLPPTLTSSINYLSNRYLRDRRLQGTLTLRGGRSDLVLVVFRDLRNALSLATNDTELLVNQINALNDNVRQRGASLGYDYRLTPNTTANATVSVTNVQSLVTNMVTNDRELSLGATRRFNARTRGSVQLRHISGRPNLLFNSNYQENAILATLSVLF